MQQENSTKPNVVWLHDIRGWRRCEDDPRPPSPPARAARRPRPPDIADVVGAVAPWWGARAA